MKRTFQKTSLKLVTLGLALAAFSVDFSSGKAGVSVASAQTSGREPNWSLVQNWAQQLQNDTTFTRSRAEQERDNGGMHRIGVQDLRDLEQAANIFYQQMRGSIPDAQRMQQQFAQVSMAYDRAERSVSRRDFDNMIVVRLEDCGRLVNSIESELSVSFRR